MQIRPRLLASALGLAALAACGDVASQQIDASFNIQSCSLGCSDGGTGLITCGVLNVHVNQEIVVEFSGPIDFSTVKKTTFKLTNTSSGVPPVGEFIQGASPNEVVFRPLIAFGSGGSPIFGFDANATYEILIPGAAQSSGPYITSVGGSPNFNELRCFLETTEGILDKNPGAPSVQVFVSQCTMKSGPGGDCLEITDDVLANGGTVITDVWRGSAADPSLITMVFDDIMNPATLLNPVTGTSDFITINVDPDGNVGDTSDQVPLYGAYSIQLDFDALTTTVVFTPSTGMPSAGSNLTSPRQIVVKFSPQIADLGGDALLNGADTNFVPEVINFVPTVIPDGTGEDFSTSKYEDVKRSGAEMWGSAGAPFLGPGETGGAGRLGDLIVVSGQTRTLGSSGTVAGVEQIWGVGVDTLTETYTNTYIIDNYDPALLELPGSGLYSANDAFALGAGASGVFEFSYVEIQPGSRLELEGDAAAQLISRGELLVQGTVDVSGFQPADHQSNAALGSVGGLGGPGAGDGGVGGDRFDYSGTEYLFDDGIGPGKLTNMDLSGIANPLFISLDGSPGEGVGGSTEGAGGGGLHWPTAFPGHDDPLGTSFTGLLQDLGGWEADLTDCRSPQLGAPGAGGAYGLDGSAGSATQVGSSVPPVPLDGPDSVGGSAASVLVGDLSPETGGLRGGAGGGAAGTHVLKTKVDGTIGDCLTPSGIGLQVSVIEFTDHSGAGGGGGGGAVQLQGGRLVGIAGSVDASGGRGGSADKSGLPTQFYSQNAQAGGGGSGGAVLIQSPSIAVNTVPGRFNLLGGPGGQGPSLNFGGSGGAGVVRFELTPDSTEDLQDLVDTVVDEDLTLPGGEGSIVYSGTYDPPGTGPSAMTGAQSCWMLPDEANFFQVEYASDVIDGGTGFVTTPGWDMDVLLSGGSLSVSYRTTAPSGSSLQDLLGTVLREPNEPPNLGVTSPLVVRFQGVRSIAPITDPCDVELLGVDAQVLPESLTPWVYHPVELSGTGANDGYWDLVAATGAISAAEAAKRRPNMIRYQIVFDEAGTYEGFIFGVTNLRIGAIPE